MKKYLIRFASKLASFIIVEIFNYLNDKNSPIYKMVAENFCDVLLQEMARDVEKRNQQLEESVNRVRNTNKDIL